MPDTSYSSPRSSRSWFRYPGMAMPVEDPSIASISSPMSQATARVPHPPSRGAAILRGASSPHPERSSVRRTGGREKNRRRREGVRRGNDMPICIPPASHPWWTRCRRRHDDHRRSRPRRLRRAPRSESDAPAGARNSTPDSNVTRTSIYFRPGTSDRCACFPVGVTPCDPSDGTVRRPVCPGNRVCSGFADALSASFRLCGCVDPSP
jgi:hypothetical protein